jgi:sodium/potassium-transporting ATPase subunit beta
VICCLSSAKIGLFYLIFYSCLAGFFAIMLVGFFATLSDTEPTQQGMYSLIKSNPGMGFRPMISVESTLIRFEQGKPTSYKDHIENIEKQLQPYLDADWTDYVKCSPDYTQKKCEKDKPCEACSYNLTEQFAGTNCTKENEYGYKEGKPCILLKINKVFGWQPVAFNSNTSSGEFYEEAKKALGPRMNPRYVGVSCDGENEGDADNVFNVTFAPNLGFSFAFYPYYNNPNYLPPVVFVQMNVRKGALIQVWCKLWVENIKHHKNDKAGSTHFELLVD